MNKPSRIRRRHLVLTTQCSILAFTLWLVPVGALDAEILLRWKLKAGDSLSVQTRQETQSQVTFSSKSATSQIDVNVQMNWTVTAARDNEVTMKQTIERIGVKLATPQGSPIEFDSADPSRPSSQARQLSESLKPLIGAEMEVTLSRRGEILAVQPHNDAAKALFVPGDSKDESASDSRTAVERLLRTPLIVLPEKDVAQGDTWTTTSDLETAAGAQRQETVYSLENVDNQGGQKTCHISADSKLTARPAAAASKGAPR